MRRSKRRRLAKLKRQEKRRKWDGFGDLMRGAVRAIDFEMVSVICDRATRFDEETMESARRAAHNLATIFRWK